MPRATVATPPQTRGRPGYTREDVIRIAVNQFNTHGYEATSMGALALTLGVSKSAIYHHITSKEEILVEATDHALLALFDVIDTADALEGDAKDRLTGASTPDPPQARRIRRCRPGGGRRPIKSRRRCRRTADFRHDQLTGRVVPPRRQHLPRGTQ